LPYCLHLLGLIVMIYVGYTIKLITIYCKPKRFFYERESLNLGVSTTVI
jgi:hypothetical protein